MRDYLESILKFSSEVKLFFSELGGFLIKTFHLQFIKFEEKKGVIAQALYKKRGRLANRLIHTGMAALAAVGIVIAPVVAQEFPGKTVDPWEIAGGSSEVLAATAESTISTQVSDKVRDKVTEYEVQPGDTVSSVADKFGVSEDTVKWQNDLTGTNPKIKEGQTLEILPVTGISHKVKKGDTVYSIAKKYGVDAQVIVNYPFNSFANDETFELAVGQTLIVPEGTPPSAAPTTPRTYYAATTPDAGSVTGQGSFVWPTSGTITQYFVWYHPGVDIANRAAPAVLAADSGTVVYAGCLTWGYGCHIIIDHGNGYRTLYGHLQRFYISQGQGVARGAAIGQMGSTGRSTGTHLHFEVIKNGVHINPLGVLK